MKLIITSAADQSAGIPHKTWEIDCPFEMDEGAETLSAFKQAQLKNYQEFDIDIRADYDFEIAERPRMEDEARPNFGSMWESYQKVQAERKKRAAWGAE